MKKHSIRLIFLAAAAATALSACKEKQTAEQPSPAPQPAAPVEQEPVLSYLPAVALYNPGALYKPDKDEEGLMVWNKSINCGTVLEAYSYSDSGVETKTAARMVKNERQERQFVHVRYNGDDYWIQDITVALEAEPNVIVADDTFIYKKADIKSMTNTSIPFGSIIAVSPQNSDEKFTCISVDTEKETFREVYVKTENVGSGNDMTILALIAAIQGAKHEVLRNELTEALAHFGSSSTAVSDKKHELMTKVAPDVDTWITEETLPGIFGTDDDAQPQPEEGAY